MQLDHVTIRTRDLETTRGFLLRVFNLEEGERPLAIRRIPGHWLYSQGHPVVHIIGSPRTRIDPSPEAIDPVGFRMEGHAAFPKKLRQLCIHYSPRDLPHLQAPRRLFHAPVGPSLEAT